MDKIAAMERKYADTHDFGMADAHCHINLFDDPGEVIREAAEAGVKTIITAGGNQKDNADVDLITRKYGIYGVIGIGPDVALTQEDEIDKLKGMMSANKNILGIGEIGLDFKVAQDEKGVERQKQVFLKQIEISKDLNVPIVIHARKAIREVLDMVIGREVEKAMFHFFEGGVEEAKAIEENDYLISIPPLYSKKRKKVIAAVGIDTLVTETDSPVAGSKPIDVKKSIEYIAGIKKMDINEVVVKTTENLREFFYI